MTQSSSGVLPLRNNQDVVICRQAVRRLASERGFDLTGQTMLMTAASELARNAVGYGRGGHVTFEVISGAGSVGIRLVFVDHGPGIADIPQAMVDGWTSGKGMGLGLSGAKRLVHEFNIVSTVGEGTTVTIVRWNLSAKSDYDTRRAGSRDVNALEYDLRRWHISPKDTGAL